MNLQPANLEELQNQLASACACGQKIVSVDLQRLNRLLEHVPEDMTATAETGITLAEFQTHIGAHRQWLPIDPPHAETITLSDLLSSNLSGPRRCGYGTVRDYLIGLKVVLASGELIKSGGKVVKNVAGYDLAKLFLGARGTLGVIVEATFKLIPQPELEAFAEASFSSLTETSRFIETVLNSGLAPAVLDLHNLSRGQSSAPNWTVVLGFAGAREDVESQLTKAHQLGSLRFSNLNHELEFWSETGTGGADPVRKLSVLPSQLFQKLEPLARFPIIARAGNGLLFYRGGPAPTHTLPNAALMRRIKQAYDPKSIFPELT